jgi:hypothetical protein
LTNYNQADLPVEDIWNGAFIATGIGPERWNAELDCSLAGGRQIAPRAELSLFRKWVPEITFKS